MPHEMSQWLRSRIAENPPGVAPSLVAQCAEPWHSVAATWTRR
jgi:hypothetical protein